MTGITVRKVSPLDPAALRMIDGSEREQAALYPAHLRTALAPEELEAQGVRFFVAFDGAEPVGSGGYGIYGEYAELKRIYVAPDARGKGVSDAVMRACEAAALGEGQALMRLETGHATPAAIRLYQRHGYAVTGPFGSYAENGSSVFMEKALQ